MGFSCGLGIASSSSSSSSGGGGTGGAVGDGGRTGAAVEREQSLQLSGSLHIAQDTGILSHEALGVFCGAP